MTLNQAVTHQISQLPEVADTLTQVLSVESASQHAMNVEDTDNKVLNELR